MLMLTKRCSQNNRPWTCHGIWHREVMRWRDRGLWVAEVPAKVPRNQPDVRSGMLTTHAWQLCTVSLARQAGREGEGSVSVSCRPILSVSLHFRFSLYQFCKLLWYLERLHPTERKQVENGRPLCTRRSSLCLRIKWLTVDRITAQEGWRGLWSSPHSLRQLEFHGQVIEDFLNQMQIDVNFQLQLKSENFAGAWKENPGFSIRECWFLQNILIWMD